MLRAIHLQPPDHVPCALMSFTALRRQVYEDMYALARSELAMGLDSFLFIPSAGRPLRRQHPDLRGLPVRFHPEVKTQERRSGDMLYKEYHTPGGVLSTRVRLSGDWPHGDHIPFVDDYQVPRAVKPLVTEPADLEALQYLLIPPGPADLAAYQQEVEQAQRFTQAHGILLVGGWGVGMDMADWLCGVDNLMRLALQQEAFVAELLSMIHAWNVARMQVVLSTPLDLYIRRAWYEGCDFVTPRFYRKVILPQLKAEVDLAHEHGAKFGYICSSGILPMLDLFLEAGIDVLIGVDPVQGTHSDLKAIKGKAAGRLCVWGGVSGAVTVELGSEEEVRLAVRHAVQALGPEGFILSPVDNITRDTRQSWQNIYVLLDEWRKRW
jgi:uroporphyrinogen-III decarboxylase